jgi:hypothetical protein
MLLPTWAKKIEQLAILTAAEGDKNSNNELYCLHGMLLPATTIF